MLVLILQPLPANPNIILCVSENHSTNSFSAHHGIFKDLDPTPNLDQIGKDGILFQNAFCSNPRSGPSFAALITGMHCYKSGFDQDNNKIYESIVTLPEVLQNIGYETSFFGSWELGTEPIGFDHWEALADPNIMYNPELRTKLGSFKVQGHATDIIADVAIRWIQTKRKSKKPIFVLIQFNGTKKPWIPPVRHLEMHEDRYLPEPKSLNSDYSKRAPPSRYQEMSILKNLDLSSDFFLPLQNTSSVSKENIIMSIGQKNISRMNGEQISAWQLAWNPKNEAFRSLNLNDEELLRWKYQRFAKNYLRCVKAIDENIGRVHELLVSQKDKKWTFLYTANQGNCLGENGWFGSSWGYDCSVKVPLIIKKSGQQKSIGRVNKSLVQLIDLFPTILGHTNQLTEELFLQGLDLNPLLDGKVENLNRKALYFDHNEFPGYWMVPKYYAVRTNKFKIIHYHQFNEWEFFDLKKDPMEQFNCYETTSYANELYDMKKLLFKTRSGYGIENSEKSMPEQWRRLYRGPNARKKD